MRITSSFRPTVCLHAEKLHIPVVWDRVSRALDELERYKARVTFLIYPFRAISEEVDISARVKEIAARGQEVGQHTHFYHHRPRGGKRNELSDENVRACLVRDHDWLTGLGIAPKGFCAGAWLMTNTILETLAGLGFQYDCSTRLPYLRRNREAPTMFSDRARVRHVQGRRLALLPTTECLSIFQRLHPLRRRRRGFIGGEPYELLYNHDEDLLISKIWQGFTWRLRRFGFTTGAELASRALAGPDPHSFAGVLPSPEVPVHN